LWKYAVLSFLPAYDEMLSVFFIVVFTVFIVVVFTAYFWRMWQGGGVGKTHISVPEIQGFAAVLL
jgi:hypothetical protein